MNHESYDYLFEEDCSLDLCVGQCFNVIFYNDKDLTLKGKDYHFY